MATSETITTIRCRLSDHDRQGNALAAGDAITSYLGFGTVAYTYDSRGTWDGDSIVDLEVPTVRLDDARDALEGDDVGGMVRVYEVRS